MNNKLDGMNAFKLMLGLLWLFLASCTTNQSKLERLVATNKASGEVHNELLFGIALGMPLQEFYQYCAMQNQEQKFHHGGRHQQVLVKLDQGFSKPVDFYFFSAFNDKQVLVAQENKFMYRSWAPWVEQTKSSYLLPEVLSFLSREFGDNFEEFDMENGQRHFIHIDGNRRIDVYIKPLDDTYVYMDVQDLSTAK